MDEKLWAVRISTEIVVRAKTSTQAESIAEMRKRDAIDNMDVDPARRIRASSPLPDGYSDDDLPYVDDSEEDNEVEEMTITEIRAAAVQEFVDAG